MNPASDYNDTYEIPNIKVAGTKEVYFIQSHAFIFSDSMIVQKLNLDANSWMADDGILLRIEH